MPVKMPFTGTVLDHLTKPRPDTRFCTGVLRQSYPAVRPPPLPFIPGVTPTTSPAASPTAAAMTHAASASAPAAAVASGTAASIHAGAAAVTGAVPGNGPVTSSNVAVKAEASSADPAAQTASASQNSQAAALNNHPALDETQRHEPNASADSTPSQINTNAALQAAQITPHNQNQHSVTDSTVKQAPGSTTTNTTSIPVKSEPATAGAAATTAQPSGDPSLATAQTPKQEPTAAAQSQQASAAAVPVSHASQQEPGTSSNGASAPNPALAAATLMQQQAQQQQQQATTSGMSAVPLQSAGQGPVVPGAVGADPWNSLDVMWDSDTPPAWPKLVCPWQVGLHRCLPPPSPPSPPFPPAVLWP